MAKASKHSKITPEKLMNEGLGNQEKFQDNTYRKLKGDIEEENIESIEKAEKEDINEKSA